MSLSRMALACGVAVLVVACKSGTDGPVPTDLVVTPTTVPLTSISQTQQLTVAVKDQNGASMSGFSPTFSSSATSVATVSSSGVVTAVASGSATITVTAAGLSANVSVTVTQAAASLAKVSGDAQTGLENAQLPTALKVKANDALGTGVAGVVITFTVSGGGTLNDSTVTTDAAGEAQVTWTLGPSSSAQQITASAPSLTSVNFTATATSASALTIAKYAGDGQTVLVGSPANIRPAVRIVNGASQPVQGINVTFAVTGGGGSISGSTTIATNASGIAQVAAWTAGAVAGSNTMSATGSGTFSGSNSVSFTATAQTAQYNIEIRNIGPAFSTAVQSALNAAEAYWEQIIYGELSNIAVNHSPDFCGLGLTLNETIDDLLILARFDSIDGPDKTLGRAGPCAVRGSNYLTVYGQMVFDTADVAAMISRGTLNAVILHEMGHVLGFTDGIWNPPGTISQPRTCAQNVPRESTSPYNGTAGLDSHFSCPGTRAAFDSIGGGSFTGGSKVPIENCTGLPPDTQCSLSGTIYVHWRESVFASELMTGYVSSSSNPLSVLTIASFGDIGYVVNYAAAQPYSQTFTAPAAARGALIDLGDDILRVPLAVVDDATGRVIRIGGR